MRDHSFIPLDYEVFAGLDVDKRSISVTFTTHRGFLKSLRMPYSVEHLLTYVRKHFPEQKVAFAYEAGPTAYGLYDGLVAEEYRCLIASPSMIPKALGHRVKDKLRTRPCSRPVRFKLDQLLDSLAFNEQQVGKTTKEIRRFCQQESELVQCIHYLMTLPGIGWIVASQLVARIGDWRELRNSRQLGGFLGVVPTEHSTGDRTAQGAITHAGDPRLRSKLIQAAWAAIRQDGELRDFYRTVCRRHPWERAARVAIVAVARKLSVRIAVVLMHQRAYEVRKPV